MIAYLPQSENPDNTRMAPDCPWTSWVYTDGDQLPANAIVVSNEDWEVEYNKFKDQTLRVYDLVEEQFQSYSPAKIDFTIHLRPNVVLNKKTTMLKNGRPSKAEYFYGADKICEIVFEFTVNAQNFMTTRVEKLGYVNSNNTILEYFTIYSKTYDTSSFFDKASVTEERSDARQYIMKEIKAVLNDVLGLYYIVLPPVELKQTPQQLWQLAGNFWRDYSSEIDAWYNTATEDFKAKILADTAYPFLDLVVPTAISQQATSMTVRAYIVDRITY